MKVRETLPKCFHSTIPVNKAKEMEIRGCSTKTIVLNKPSELQDKEGKEVNNKETNAKTRYKIGKKNNPQIIWKHKIIPLKLYH